MNIVYQALSPWFVPPHTIKKSLVSRIVMINIIPKVFVRQEEEEKKEEEEEEEEENNEEE